MATELYDLTIAVFLHTFDSLSKILAKGEAYARDQGIDPAELLDARLIADMAPLTSQIQRASDSAKGFAVRLGGVANVVMADDEASFADLQARIAKTVAFLKAVPRDSIDGKEETSVVLERQIGSFTCTGRDFALRLELPNVFFHVTTAYALLRMKGVPLGKADYIGQV